MVTKVAIVGGGPSGLMAAIKAAEAGMQVKLYEKGKIGEGIKCAEGFLDSLKLCGQPEEGVRFPVDKMLFRMNNEYELDVGDVSLWMIDRREWQCQLARRARSLKVEINEGFPVDEKGLTKLQRDNQWVIEASGVFPVTARKFGFSDFYRRNSAFTLQYVLKGDFTSLIGKIKIGLEPHYLGYYWIFPKSADEANMGVIWFDSAGVVKPEAGAKLELNRVIAAEGLADYQIVRQMGGVCPVKVPEKLIYENIILVGDSAGLTSPLHGGGLDLACLSSGVAVDCIKHNLVDQYRTQLMNLVGDKLDVEARLLEVWRQLSFDEVDALIKLIALEWYSINPLKLSKYPGLLIKEMGTILRFWKGMTAGDWQAKSLLGVGAQLFR